MAALNGPAPTDLRVNLLKADREEARRALAAEGVAAEPTPLSPLGLRLRERVPLGNLAAFKQGLVEVQDESSQIAALLADARPGMRVVDFCAGAGGKTLALAAGMAQSRQARRLRGFAAPPRSRRRAGCAEPALPMSSAGVERRTRQMGQAPRRRLRPGLRRCPLPRHRHWRRNPDAKWRMRPEDLAELVERQQQSCAAPRASSARADASIYATCSLLREEDEAQAEAFLAAEPDFALLPVARAWDETIGGASPGGEPYLRLTPARHGTDGFFVAFFERQPTSDGSPPCPTAS